MGFVVAGVVGGFAAGAAGIIAGGLSSLAIGAAVGYGLKATFDYVMDSMVDDVSVDTMGGRTVTKKDSTATRKIVYGTVRTGGTIVYQENSGTENEFLHNVVVFSEGEINEISEIYFDDVKVLGLVDGNIRYYNKYSTNADGTASQNSDVVDIELSSGASINNALTSLTTYQVEWSEDHDLSKIAHAYIRLRYSDEIYTNGFPKITAIIKGKHHYDPRQDSTATAYSGSGSQRIDDESTWEYSNNSAVCLLNYMLDDRIGLGESLDAFDAPSLLASMDDCDSDATIYNNLTQKKYTCDGIIDSKNSHKANIQNILTSMNGQLLYSGGKYHVKSYKYEIPHSQVVTEDMILGDIDIATKVSRRSLYNRVKGKFVSEEDNYVMTEYPTQIYYEAGTTNLPFEIDDGETLYHEYNLPMTTNHIRAQRLARLTMLRSRMQSSIKFSTNAKGLLYTVGDNIKVTNSTLGIIAKVYQIQRLNVRPDTEKGLTVHIEAKENVEEFYNWAITDVLDFDSGQTVSLFSGAVSAPTNLQLEAYYENNQSKMRASWNASSSQGDIIYKVFYRKANTFTRLAHEAYTYDTFIEIAVKDYLEGQPVQFFVQAMRQASGVHSSFLSGSTKAAKRVDDNPNFIVRGTFADPTLQQVTELCAEAGIPINQGREVTYLQINDNGDVLNAIDFEFETMSLSPITTKIKNDVVGATYGNQVANPNFNDASQWGFLHPTITEFTINTETYKLDYESSGNISAAIQFISNIQVGARYTGSFNVNNLVDNTSSLRLFFTIRDFIDIEQQIINIPIHDVGNGTHTFNFVAPTDTIAIAFLSVSEAGASAEFDNVIVERDDEQAEHKIVLSLPPSVTADVSWTYSVEDDNQTTTFTNDNSVGIVDESGVTPSFVGFDDSYKVNRRKSVEVGLTRAYDSIGFSQCEITVTANWTQIVYFGGVAQSVPKTATETVVLSARVR